MIELLYRVLLAVLAVGATVYPIYYHFATSGDWRRSAMGRHLMGYTTAAALLADAGIIRVFFSTIPGQEEIRLGAIAVAVFFVWQRLFITVRAQRQHEPERTTLR